MNDQHYSVPTPPDLRAMLRSVGLRPTRQRMDLARILFAGGDRHVTAESLHEEVRGAGVSVSVATIYNTLHQFTQAGLLRAFAVDGTKTYFDTNTSEHHHFYCEHSGTMTDIPGEQLRVHGVPRPPQGMEVTRVDVIVRLSERRR